MSFDYIKDPLEIERQSFQQIRELTDLSRFSDDQHQVAMRMVHTCGDPNVVNSLVFCGNAIEAGLQALEQQAPILCDVEMVRNGLTRRYLNNNEAYCFLNDADAVERAKANGETRTMAAVESWRPLLKGSIVLIGNAPTALFRLLEIIKKGGHTPALIIGMPVGFVGAAESKQALIDTAINLHLNAITLRGRVGGSALCVSALNALARQRHGELY